MKNNLAKNRVIVTAFFVVLSCATGLAQKLPSKITDQPDGITFGYFNVYADKCTPRLFIGYGLQILFPCYSKGKYDRVDVSMARQEIEQLRKVLNVELIRDLNECCTYQNCPDTGHGYYLMIKQGTESNFVYLDYEFIDSNKCGSTALNEAIALLHNISNNYAP